MAKSPNKVVELFFFITKLILGSVIWIVLGFAGYWIFRNTGSPWKYVIGFPLIFVAGGFVLNNVVSIILSDKIGHSKPKYKES